jgi:16S rRNA (guanine966-N2)-methyltransferase
LKKQAPELRPLTSRALTSAIDTLRPRLADALVLDLFAGHGRFGISALENGARGAIFVEKAKDQVAHIEKELQKYRLKGEVECEDVFKFLGNKALAGKFDVVFADPPFPDWNPTFVKKLFDSVSRVISHEGIFLVKYPKQVVAFDPVSPFDLWKKTQFGESLLLYFTYVE